MLHRMLPRLKDMFRVEQEVVPVEHPNLEWIAFINFYRILLQAFIYLKKQCMLLLV